MSPLDPDRYADRDDVLQRPTAAQADAVLRLLVERRRTARASASNEAAAAPPDHAAIPPVEGTTTAQRERPNVHGETATLLPRVVAKIADDDVIDVRAVAKLMHVGRNTLYAMVARNEIPHRRFGRCIRFSRAAVVRWLASWSSQGAKEGH